MREPIRDKERIEHMLQAIDVILSRKDRQTFEEVKADPIVYFGFVKHVEIVSEACYKLTKEFRNSHPEMDWDAIEGMRHVLVHGYYQIREEQLWDTIQNDIPELKAYLQGLYNSIP